MANFRTIYSETFKLLTQHRLQAIVSRFQGDKRVRKLAHGSQFVVLMILCLSFSTVHCDRSKAFRTYTLDVSDIVTSDSGRGTLIISHNAVAVFPINMDARNRRLAEVGPNTIIEAQTLSACDGTGRTPLPDDHEIVRNINAVVPIATKDVADIRSISLDMPYNATQDDFTRIPGTLCVGFHIKDNGWVWDFTPIAPKLDDEAKTGFAKVTVNERNVDIIGILFDSTTNIDTISFEARKVE